MREKIPFIAAILLFAGCIVVGCSAKSGEVAQTRFMQQWEEKAEFSKEKTQEELYQDALLEKTLVVYSVTSRIFEVKDSFEKKYPGLIVEVKDIRSQDVVSMAKAEYERETYNCDVIICSDGDGSLNQELIESGICYSYIPIDILPKMKEGHFEDKLYYVGEALMPFYNTSIFEEQPIHNIWELTEKKYKNKIIMANPLSSFSTYAYSAVLLKESDRIAQAYTDYTGEVLVLPEGKTAGEFFWEKLSEQVVFVNSSDDVIEGIGSGREQGMMIGIMISSKMRLLEVGYHFAPIYQLNPYAAVYTPNSALIAGGSRNINAAKLFIWHLLGETDGKGEGIKPYSTLGTWSVRKDIEDGNDVGLEEIDVIFFDREYLYEKNEYIRTFLEGILDESVKE